MKRKREIKREGDDCEGRKGDEKLVFVKGSHSFCRQLRLLYIFSHP